MKPAPRPLFTPDHDAFRDQVRRFCEREIAPHHAAWEEAHGVPRSVWKQAGDNGLLCCWLPESLGGPGADLLFDFIVSEELGRIGATGPGFPLHSVIVAPYLAAHGTPELQQAILPGMVSGDRIAAIAMTEPGTGSDVAAIRTTARRDGDHYVLNGQKTFITNGHNADVIVVACKTDPEQGARGVSLLVVEGDMPGFTRGRNLRKIGQHAQDTAELFFDQVRVPASHLLGAEGEGFKIAMKGLDGGRINIATCSVGAAQGALNAAQQYMNERSQFGKKLAAFQALQFKLADMQTELVAARQMVRLAAFKLDTRSPDATTYCAMAKRFATDACFNIVNEALQLHGGYGYLREFPLERLLRDVRVHQILEGTNEIMRVIVSRRLLGDRGLDSIR